MPPRPMGAAPANYAPINEFLLQNVGFFDAAVVAADPSCQQVLPAGAAPAPFQNPYDLPAAQELGTQRGAEGVHARRGVPRAGRAECA